MSSTTFINTTSPSLMGWNDLGIQKRGHLAKVWLAAHYEKKLTRKDILTTNLTQSIEDMVKDGLPKGLRLHSQLLMGTVRIYSRQTKYLLDECNEAKLSIQMAFRPGNTYVDLPVDQASAAFHQITLPDTLNEQDLLFQPMASTHLLQTSIASLTKVTTTTSLTVPSSARPQDITLDDLSLLRLSPEQPRDAFQGVLHEDPLDGPNFFLDSDLNLNLEETEAWGMKRKGEDVSLNKPFSLDPFTPDDIELTRRNQVGVQASRGGLLTSPPPPFSNLDEIVLPDPFSVMTHTALSPSFLPTTSHPTSSIPEPTLTTFPIPPMKRPRHYLDDVTEIPSDQFSKQLQKRPFPFHPTPSMSSSSSSSLSSSRVTSTTPSLAFLDDVCDTLKQRYPHPFIPTSGFTSKTHALVPSSPHPGSLDNPFHQKDPMDRSLLDPHALGVQEVSFDMHDTRMEFDETTSSSTWVPPSSPMFDPTFHHVSEGPLQEGLSSPTHAPTQSTVPTLTTPDAWSSLPLHTPVMFQTWLTQAMEKNTTSSISIDASSPSHWRMQGATPLTKKSLAVTLFYEVLLLTSKHLLQVDQQQPYMDFELMKL
ncbi:Double-strand-break repair protein rad21, partial [Coelomomyces lativittatus]